MSKIVHVDTKEELIKVLEENDTVLVDFFATWCGPCKMLSPVLEEIAEEQDGKTLVVKIDIDRAESLAIEYRVMSVPTLFYFKDGKTAAKAVGLQSKTQIMNQLEKL